MKKRLLCLLMVLGLAGCNFNQPTDNSQTPSEDNTPVNPEPSGDDTQPSGDETPSGGDEQPGEDDTPTVPDEPVIPTDPTDPEDPVDPGEPDNPDNPDNPDEPGEPEEPEEPGEPTEPEDPNKPLDISIGNLYFADYSGGDIYLEELEEKFNVNLTLRNYDWTSWDTQIAIQVNSDNLADVFHADVNSTNYGNTYKKWVENEVVKPLPEDLSKWPNIESLIQHTSNIDCFKIDGKLYGIPIHQDDNSFANYTYIYRRDWAKKWGVYQENDEYTWEQFEQLLAAFKVHLDDRCYPLADVEWGYPSITNFYKQAPYCYAQNSEGQYVNNFTTDEYIIGLEKAKAFTNNLFYHPDQFNFTDGRAQQYYVGNMLGVFYENISYSNYFNIRRQLTKTNAAASSFNLDDATAIMKIKAPSDSIHANKYVLEGKENWFAMTLFDHGVTDKQQERVLDMFDWLLSEEGTRYAIYGKEGFDYNVVNDNIELIDEQWTKDPEGNYARKNNGAKYLRYAVSLGLDTLAYDPYTNLEAYNILKTWQNEMKQALENNALDIIKENAEVAYLATPQKANYTNSLLYDANVTAMKYVYNKIKTISDYKAAFDSSKWNAVLSEINEALGK